MPKSLIWMGTVKELKARLEGLKEVNSPNIKVKDLLDNIDVQAIVTVVKSGEQNTAYIV